MIFIWYTGSAGRWLSWKDGKIVEAGRADDVFYAPKEAYTKKLGLCDPGI